MLCHQNAFFGATPRHVVLSNVIRRVLNNIQSKFYGRQELLTTSVCVLGPAVEEEGFSMDGVNTSRVGLYRWAFNLERNVFKYNGTKIIQHKCSECGEHSDYANGNNYHKKWKDQEYYCPDAATLFEAS